MESGGVTSGAHPRQRFLPLPESTSGKQFISDGWSLFPLSAPCLTIDGSHWCRPNTDISCCSEFMNAQWLCLAWELLFHSPSLYFLALRFFLPFLTLMLSFEAYLVLRSVGSSVRGMPFFPSRDSLYLQTHPHFPV